MPVLHLKRWESRLTRWKRSSRNGSGAAARQGSSSKTAREACLTADAPCELGKALLPHCQRDQAKRADNNAPPREQRKPVAGHVVQECLHHDDSRDERYE